MLPHNTSRSIHISSFIPRATRPSGSTVQNIFKQTRTLFSTFVSHLTKPGTLRHVPAVGRCMHASPAYVRPTIQQGLSLPARYALGRPLHGPYIPRPPVIPRSVTQVGLGTARNFCTSRSAFQTLADNVPITGRAFWEADWELRVKKEKEAGKIKKYTSKKRVAGNGNKEMQQPKLVLHESVTESSVTDNAQETELDNYFTVPAVPSVTTYLLIPIAPTPTLRHPLPLSPPAHSSIHPLLPFSVLSSIHTDHATHTLRVSTLFARLDTARVFDKGGVTTSAFGDPSGLCSVLEVKFAGWTESQVRSIIGEAGVGWCVLEEVREDEKQIEIDSMDEIMSALSSGTATPPQMDIIDPAASFVLPTLDFSASFPATTASWSPSPSVSELTSTLSDLQFENHWSSASSDSGSETSYTDASSHVSWDNMSVSSVRHSGSEGWIGLGFSSQFSGRLHNEVPEPMERMF
ncbi:hypothetical protein NLI96_g9350 [Meripilus lineatus]|uniref:Uncharacterized protein n=1 Tax=Meripilus lineatus TaxID=2056292 RepID=A0AAD5YB55_9APHY|nr:hypothetical protein NLI96_g9350 [Physisporinus lineatus]